MITSVHVAKLGPTGLVFRGPKPSKVRGLLSADAGITSPLSAAFLPRLDPSRSAMIAFWESEDALDEFLESDRVGRRLADGWHARLTPLREHGSWPGLPPMAVTRSRSQPEHSDAIAVDRAKAFHHSSAFVRFRPLSVAGSLDGGRNPIPALDLV